MSNINEVNRKTLEKRGYTTNSIQDMTISELQSELELEIEKLLKTQETLKEQIRISDSNTARLEHEWAAANDRNKFLTKIKNYLLEENSKFASQIEDYKSSEIYLQKHIADFHTKNKKLTKQNENIKIINIILATTVVISIYLHLFY